MVTNEDITEAAFRLFAAKGFHETSTENIADLLGIKKQSLYSHFKSKGEIMLSVLRVHSEQINREIDGIILKYRDKSTEMLLKFIFAHIAIYFSERDRLLFWKRIFYFDKNNEFGDILQNNNWQFDRKLHSELGVLLKSKYPHFNDPEIFRSFFLSYMIVIHGYLDWMLIAGFDEHTVESTWANFWRGMQAHF